MSIWIFEPGHSAAEFCARHMMVSWVRGHFKDVHGLLRFDLDDPAELAVEATIQTSKLWSGEPQRDNHLRGADFLDVANHPTITFKSTGSRCIGAADHVVTGDLTIRGVHRPVELEMHCLGKWSTSYWTDAGDTGPVTRVGFVGQARINRQDFKVSWNGPLPGAGVVISDEILLTVDVEAILESDLNRALQTKA